MYHSGMTIADVLADAITAKGLPQVAAAEQIGVQQSAVSRWVNGKDTPGDEHVRQLAKFTGLTQTQVLAAIHEQRLQRQSLKDRVRRLEASVDELMDLVRGLVDERRPDGGSRS